VSFVAFYSGLRSSRKESARGGKQIEDEPKTFALIFQTGDEIAGVLRQFAKHQGLGGSSFKAIGALSYAKLGWFNWETKKYDPACVLDEQVELLSVIGDIALKDGEPQVHAHVVVGRSDGIAYGGHLLEARVRPTCELILTESPIHLQKKLDPESGIPLIQIEG
jgi:predicted DNA-binding protein with PD1-like motif